jgi:DNA replication protein DnaC
MTTKRHEALHKRAHKLGLSGVLAHWEHYATLPWLEQLLAHEEEERQHRSLERRIKSARIGRFKPIADFDWKWPKEIPRAVVEELFSLQFIADVTNVVLIGPNGVGKSMIAQNLAHCAVLNGHTVRFTTASAMLNELASQDGAMALRRRIQHYCRPDLLAIDEVGYLSYDNRHADLLFEIVTRRYQKRPLIVTTNKIFKEWNEVFPNAACVVTLIDRMVHRSEIVKIDGESYRLKEAKEAASKRAKRRQAAKPKANANRASAK